eukprot:g10748.t1
MSSLATCSDVIRFWDTAGGGGLELRKTTNVAAAATNSCCWNHNGQVVATAGDNGSITVLKLSGSLVPAGVLSAHERPIRGITFSSKSRKLAAGGDAGVVEVWDLKRNNSRVTMRGHRGAVTCVSFFERDSCVAAGDERGKVVLHRVADAPSDDEALATLPPAGGYASVTGLCMASPAAGAGTLGVSYADGSVRLWDTGSRACVREMKEHHRGSAAGIVFHPLNPSLMATVGHDGMVRCTDVRTGSQDKHGGLRSIQSDGPLTCGSFHHEGLMLAAGASDGTVRLMDLRTAREIGAGSLKKAYAGPSPPPGGVRALAFQRQPSARSSTAGGATPASVGSGVSNGTSKVARASTGSSRHQPTPAAVAGVGVAAAPSSSEFSRAGATGSSSGRSKLLPDGSGSGGGGGDGNVIGGGDGSAGGRIYGEGSGGGRRRSAPMTSPAAAEAAVEGTPLFPAGSSSGSTHQHHHHQQHQQRYQQPAAEHTSSSRDDNQDYYYSPAAAGGTGSRRGFVSGESEKASTSLQQQHQQHPQQQQRHREPYGFSGAEEEGRAGGGGHQSVATPPRERDEASQLWSDDGRDPVSGKGTPVRTALRAYRHGGSAGAADGDARRSSAPPLPPPPLARRRPDSSGPERVAAGFDRRRGENGASSHGTGGSGGNGTGGTTVMGEVDEREDPSTTNANDNGCQDGEDAAFAATPRSRGTVRIDAAGGGGGGDWGTHTNGDAPHARSRCSTPASPSRAPRKRGSRAESPSAGPKARAGAAPAAGDWEGALVRHESEGATAGAAGGGRVVSVDRSVLEQVLSSHLSGLREELRQELRNLHVDMLRQFHSLQDEQSSALAGFEERLGGLVAENQALRAENDRLRRVY